MKIQLLLIFVLSWISIHGAPVPALIQEPVSCPAVLTSGGASQWFAGSVAHAVHSMTLQGLRQFEPSAKTNNGVPVINEDLASPNAILENAPDSKGPSDKDFVTNGMKIMDRILSNMGKKDWNIKNYNTLETLAHEFHMNEFWAETRQVYQQIKAKPPAAGVCKCANDIQNNGIMKSLRYIALAIREPELVYGKFPDVTLDKKAVPQSEMKEIPRYSFNIHFVHVTKNTKSFWLALYPGGEAKKIPALVDSEAWEEWKRLAYVGDATKFDTALYLYCALNH